MKQPNIDPTTGIAYGYISAAALDADVVHQLLYGFQARDLSCAEAEARAMEEAETRASEIGVAPVDYDWWVEREVEHAMGDYSCDEPTIEGVLDGLTYSASWLGGALHFFILASPHVTDDAGRASPCVPNAGILDAMGGGVRAYDVPSDWRSADT
ncbi:MAG: hypothetical protein RBU21_02840 [FCB group bacterium]|nr:hypothetical protein [FCB group bacterium]